jgi:hypothetical protein
MANVRYIDGDSIKNNFFICKMLPKQTAGNKIFQVTDEHLHENGQ